MPEHISAKTVAETWQRMAQASVQETEQVVDQMKREQPVILGYLVSLEEYPFDTQEREIIFYIGLVVWQILKQNQANLSKVEHKTIKEAEAANNRFLELLSSGTEAGLVKATQAMLENYDEPEVLRYVLEAIMEGESPESGQTLIRDECLGLAFIHLKVILDAFISTLAQ